jgi:hypothetical protein
MRYREIINEASLLERAIQVSIVIHTLRGKSSENLTVYENSLKPEIIALCRKHPAMDGDVNLRGIAHGGKCWVWEAQAATHQQVAEGLGLVDPQVLDWLYDPAFCAFYVIGYGFQQGEPDGKNYIGLNGETNSSTLSATTAKRWGIPMTDYSDRWS